MTNPLRKRQNPAGNLDLVPLALADAKGDLLAGTGPDALARHPVGTNHQHLIALATEPAGVAWRDPAEIWSNAQFPLTDLRPGRMILAQGPRVTWSEQGVGSFVNTGRRPYIYDPDWGWRLVNPFRISVWMTDHVTVPVGGRRSSAMSIDIDPLGAKCEVLIRAQGCVEPTVSTGSTEAIAEIALGTNTASILRRGCLWLDSGFSARPTIVTEEARLANAGTRLFYALNFFTSAVQTRFIGGTSGINLTDAWEFRVELS